METAKETEILDILSSEMMLSEAMKGQQLQICFYARIAGVDMEEIRDRLHEEGLLPCSYKKGSKEALQKVYYMLHALIENIYV